MCIHDKDVMCIFGEWCTLESNDQYSSIMLKSTITNPIWYQGSNMFWSGYNSQSRSQSPTLLQISVANFLFTGQPFVTSGPMKNLNIAKVVYTTYSIVDWQCVGVLDLITDTPENSYAYLDVFGFVWLSDVLCARSIYQIWP